MRHAKALKYGDLQDPPDVAVDGIVDR